MLKNSNRVKFHYSDSKKPKKKKSSNRRPLVRNPRGRIDIYADAGKQALRDLNYLRTFINTEIHNSDSSQSGQASSSTASFNLLNGTTTGDAVNNRSGQSVKANGISLRYYVVGNASANWIAGRIMVVYDKQANGAIFAIGDLLNATTPVSMRTVGNQMRFLVLYDKNYVLSWNGNSSIIEDVNIPCQNHTEYNTGTAATVADIVTGSIYLIHFTDQATNTAAMTWYSRYWFVDN